MQFLEKIYRVTISASALDVYPADTVLLCIRLEHLRNVFDGPWVFSLVPDVRKDERFVGNAALSSKDQTSGGLNTTPT